MLDLNSHSFLYFIVRVGNGIFNITMLAIFSRMLSPLEFGAFALGLAVVTLASGVLYQWLYVAVIRFYTVKIEDFKKVTAAAAHGFWFTSAAAAVLCIASIPFREVFNLDSVTVGILFLTTVVLGRHTLALHESNALGKPLRYGMLSWSKGGGTLLAGIALISYGGGDRGALLGFLLALVISVFAFAPKPLILIKFGDVDKQLAENMFRYGLPLTFNHLVVAVLDVADLFIIGSLLGVVYVAPYAVAYGLVQQSVGPIMNVLFLANIPVIVRMFEEEQVEHVRIRLHVLGSRLIGLGLPAAIGVGFLASDISDILFSNDYRQDATMVMPWLAAAIFVGSIKSFFLDVVFQLRHETKYLGYIAMLMVAVNIALNLLLLPRYGVIAASWATLAAFTSGALISWRVGKSFFALPALGNIFWSSASASAFMIFVLYLLPPSSGLIWLLAKFAVGFIVYAVMAWVLNVGGCRRLLKV